MQIPRARRISTSFWSDLVVLKVETWSLLVDDYYIPNTATHAVYTSEPRSFGLDIYIEISFSVSSKLSVTVELSLLCIGLQTTWNRSNAPPRCALILNSAWAEHTYHNMWDRHNGVATRQDLAPSWSAPTSIFCGEWLLLHPILARLEIVVDVSYDVICSYLRKGRRSTEKLGSGFRKRHHQRDGALQRMGPNAVQHPQL